MSERLLSKAKVLRVHEAAKLMGLKDGEQFRRLAERAGVVPGHDRIGRLVFSEADVEHVRTFKRRTSWERVLEDDSDESDDDG